MSERRRVAGNTLDWRLRAAGSLAFVWLASNCFAAPANIAVYGVDSGRAAAIADHAETVRLQVFTVLLRDREPRPWLPRCSVHVHLSNASFARAVGAQPDHARGATSIEFAGDDVSLRRIDVMGDGPEVIPDALAHELVHVVLADRFREFAPPRWADEGVAMLFDTADKQAGHEADFRRAHDAGTSFTLADILALEHYPGSPARQRVFYGQSASLVRWLVARGGAAAFVDFVEDAARTSVPNALQRHYGLDSPASLDAAWREVSQIDTPTFVDDDR